MKKNYYIHDVLFNPFSYSLLFKDNRLKLSIKESELLELLCKNSGSVVSRGLIMDALWPNQDCANTNLNRAILLLRRKFESLGYRDIIETIPRGGYLIERNIVVTYDRRGSNRSESSNVADAMVVAENINDEPIVEGEGIEVSLPLSPDTVFKENPRKFFRLENTKLYILMFVASLLLIVCLVVLKFTKNDHNHKISSFESNFISVYFYSPIKQVSHDNSLLQETYEKINNIIDHENEQLSFMVGDNAISYIHINKSLGIYSNQVFFLEPAERLEKQISCVLENIKHGEKEAFHRSKKNKEVITRFFNGTCNNRALEYVEITKVNHIANAYEPNLFMTSVNAHDRDKNSLFKAYVFSYYANIDDPVCEQVISNIDFTLEGDNIEGNKIAIRILSEYNRLGEHVHFMTLANGVFSSSNFGGVLSYSR
jgi:DNA-binding winged helix-turn-helix (wHTH) protein